MTQKQIAALVAESVAAALTAAGVDPVEDETPAKKSPRKSKATTTRKSPQKPAARKSKPVPTVWTVKSEWKGEAASPRMVGAALYWCGQRGVKDAASKIEGLDKFELSKFIGKTRGIRVKVEA